MSDGRNDRYVAVEVAKAALCEAGHPDLASQVGPNREGMPTLHNEPAHRQFRPIIAKAFLLGHLAVGHDDRMTRGINSDFEWVDGLDCELVCKAEAQA